ncbi:helix-turn-helix domain-containing protein [Thermodesulfobacteriota bacterium]
MDQVQENIKMSPLLKDTQVSERFNMHVQALRNWRHQGRGPAYFKIGSAVRYREEDIIAYLNKRRIDPERK